MSLSLSVCFITWTRHSKDNKQQPQAPQQQQEEEEEEEGTALPLQMTKQEGCYREQNGAPSCEHAAPLCVRRLEA